MNRLNPSNHPEDNDAGFDISDAQSGLTRRLLSTDALRKLSDDDQMHVTKDIVLNALGQGSGGVYRLVSAMRIVQQQLSNVPIFCLASELTAAFAGPVTAKAYLRLLRHAGVIQLVYSKNRFLVLDVSWALDWDNERVASTNHDAELNRYRYKCLDAMYHGKEIPEPEVGAETENKQREVYSASCVPAAAKAVRHVADAMMEVLCEPIA